jgi:sigma-B regulation protein RsbU (phosphoserine phosphatase)
MSRGDLLVVCSDGVTDAASPDSEPFGEERLDAVLNSVVGERPSVVRRSILDAVADHVKGSPHSDDLTVVALRREPDGEI